MTDGRESSITRWRVLQMLNTDRLHQYLRLADELSHVASKEELTEFARLLAINVAHYESRFGAFPIDETLDTAYSENPNQAQIDLTARGMETFVGVLGGIVRGFEPKPSH